MRNFTLLLLALVLLGPLAIDLYLPVIPVISAGLGSADSVIQATIALFIFIMGLGQLIAGPLVDRVGRRPMALCGILIYFSGAVMAALSTHESVFIASRVVQGIAVCCTAVAVFSSVRDRLNGDEAARVFGFLNGTLNIVPALAPLFGGLISAAWGWRACFWFMAVYAVFCWLLSWRFLPETRPANTLRPRGLPVRQYARILFSARFSGFALANAGIMGMALTYVSLASMVLMTQAGLSPLQFSLAFGTNGFWIMLMSLLANRTIAKVGRPACLTIGSLLIGGGFLLLIVPLLWLPAGAPQTWWSFMLPVAVACAGLAFVIGPATSYALEPYASEAGTASALVGFIQMAGGALLGLIFMALPLPPKGAVALAMLVAMLLALQARWRSTKVRGTITALS